MHRSVPADPPFHQFIPQRITGCDQKYDFEHIRINMGIDCFDIPARSALSGLAPVGNFQNPDTLPL
jgi:hypothetical protein